MSARVRFGTLVVLAAALLAAPVVMIALRADTGSASFGDVREIGRNRIGSATLDIEVGSRVVPIGGVDLAPGDLVAGQVEFHNAGTLALGYRLEAVATSPEIADHLTWLFVSAGGGACPTEARWRARPAGTIEVAGRAVVDGADVGPMRELGVAESEVVCMAVEFGLDAPNETQRTTVELELIAHAEQLVGVDAGEPRS